MGDEHLPRPEKPSVARLARDSRCPLRVAFVDDNGNLVEQVDAEFVRSYRDVPRSVSGSVPARLGRRAGR